MTATDDHGTLPVHAERLIKRLETIGSLSVPGDVAHMQHMDHAARAGQLAGHLRATLLLSDAHHYPSALVVVRSALEHHLMDRLVFLANKDLRIISKVKKVDLAAWDAKLRAAQAGPQPDIDRWWWDERAGQINVVHRGYHSARAKKGRGHTISPYYFRMDEFDPFAGPKEHSGRLAAPFWERKHTQDWANESAQQWKEWFSHRAVLKALAVNRLIVGRRVQLDVHYAFLSGFVHPSKRGYEAIHGRNTTDRMGEFDHYASEIGLLYGIVIAAAEIEIYGLMARRAPRLVLRDWHDVLSEVREAKSAASYFWFLSGEPTMLDRIDTAHTPAGNRKPRVGRPKRDPASMHVRHVRYYVDPFKRLIELHESRSELTTGLVYQSPFERTDARFR